MGQRVLSLVAVGVKLFPFNGTEFGRVLCRLLTLLGHLDASQVTLKSVRAGRATSLAAGGHSIGEILIAGEWKSSAFLEYCQANDLSESALLDVVLEDDPEDDLFGIARVVVGSLVCLGLWAMVVLVACDPVCSVVLLVGLSLPVLPVNQAFFLYVAPRLPLVRAFRLCFWGDPKTSVGRILDGDVSWYSFIDERMRRWWVGFWTVT